MKTFLKTCIALSALSLVLALPLVAMAAGEVVAVTPEPGIWDSFIPLLGPLAAILSSVFGSVWIFLKTKLGKAIKGWVGEGFLNSAMQFTSNLALDLVLAAMQTAVKELEKSLADGKIDRREFAAGKLKVRDEVLALLREKTLGRLIGSGAASGTSDAMDLTAKLVEAAVKKVKIVDGGEPIPFLAVPDGTAK